MLLHVTESDRRRDGYSHWCSAGDNPTLRAFDRGLRAETGPRSPSGTRRRQGEEGKDAFLKGREHARGIVTVVKRRLEATTAQEREGGREWSKIASEVFLPLGWGQARGYTQVCYASRGERCRLASDG